MTPPLERLPVRSLVLVYGAETMIAQVMILRELLVLPRGQSLPFTTTFLRARRRFKS